ncbi:autotransporter-associated beta strand repeat-containing protein [Methylobacterium haplocladii]|uniref:Autotransporter domain-containing protein n=1 Tax=Methylobacterium haplocladii TaxID=1176176 RepID=A0A512IMI9_9HYPH|nr:autotransporter-associated beta strand repeat-containing protein [Methylobacterium haplocladii]GEO98936.1 hypothetical protein MHA02_13240 [Methylobacterium haplocladii]GJD84217.1 hypothetical protein HPGCJGGD_2092 [Methylobacterium haplocladii]GLS60199.1 hypothetical protein GCM10007887_28770 [Methylobacterium haplocladii]
MSSVNSTAVSVASRMRGLWLASTALVGIRILPQPAPSVLHLPSSASLLQARMARLLALAIETPASLLARLNPLRVRKVRPAARVGRRKWQRALLAATALIGGASAAAAQDISWSGNGNNDWNAPASWDGVNVPDTADERAIFGSSGTRSPFFTQSTTVGGITFEAGGSQYYISNNGHAVTFTSDIVSNSGEQFIYSNTGGVDVAFSANAGNITLISTSTPDGTSVVGTPGGGFRFDAGGQAGQAQVRFDDGGPLTVNTGANTTLNVGSLAGSGTVQFQQNNQTLSVGGLNTSTVYSGVIGTGAGASTAALTKVGSGTLTLTGDNAYTGGTTVSGGVLQIGSGGTTGSVAGNINLANNAELTINRSDAVTVAGIISGNGPLNQIGTGTTTLTGANTYVGDTRILAGTLQIGDGGSTGALGAGNVANAGTLVFNRNNALTFGGVIGNVGSVQQIGTGTTTLTGANAYAGATTIAAGILNIQNASALGTTAAGTTVANNATLQLQGGIAVLGEALTLSGNGSNQTSPNGALQNVSGVNTFGGTITLAAASRINSDAGTLQLTAGTAITGAFGLTLGGAGNGLITGAIATGANTVTKDGTGIWRLSIASNYSGGTSINAGSLIVDNGAALGTGSATVALGGTLGLQSGITVANALLLSGSGSGGTGTGTNNGALESLIGNNTYSGAITLGAASRINANAGTLTLSGGINGGAANTGLTLGGASTGANTVSGAIGANVGGLTKDGAGTWTLSGVNTYTGATTINAGTLALNNAAGTAIADTTRVTFGNLLGTAATLRTQTNETIGSLSDGNTSSTVNIAAGTMLTAGGDATTDGVYAGAINANGTGILAKTGGGTQTLSGAMTGGALVVNQGTLALGTTGSLNTAGVAGLVPGATGGQAQAAVLVNTGAIFGNAGTITATNQGVALQGGTFNNTGSVTAANQSGVFALTGAVAITNTGTGSISGVNGIDASLTSAAAISITGNGSYTGTGGFGIRAVSLGGNVVLGTTGAALGAVSGASAIFASTTGTGTVDVVTAGNVTSTGANAMGIAASGVNGAVTVNQTAGLIQATSNGIDARSTGSGAVIVNQAGGTIGSTVSNPMVGLNAERNAAGTISVTSGTIYGQAEGVRAINFSSGNVGVDAQGSITAKIGINAKIRGTTGDIAVTAGAGAIRGNTIGTTTANNDSANVGINAALETNAGATGTVSVTTGTGAVSGVSGITASSAGTVSTSAVTVNVGGNVTGTSGTGVSAKSAGGVVTVNQTAGVVQATGNGIDATTTGGRAIVVNQSGGRIGTDATTRVGGIGINATRATAGDITVTAGTIFSTGTGVLASNGGTGTGNIKVDGVSGGSITATGGGIFATTSGTGNVVVGGTTAIGSITTGGFGISAYSKLGGVSVNTAAGTIQSGAGTAVIAAQNDSNDATGAVTISNAATLQRAAGAPSVDAIGVTDFGSGGVTITNTGAIGGAAGFGAFSNGINAASTYGSVTVTTSGAGVIGAALLPTSNGIVASSSVGGVTVQADANVSAATRGVIAQAQNSSSGAGSTVTVRGAGAISGGTGIRATHAGTGPGAGNAAVTISGTGATTGTTGIGIDAAILNAGNAGNMLVTRSGTVTAATTGVNATTLGAGTVTVSAGPITTTNGSGVVATGTSGVVAVTANGAITSGSTGVATNAGIFLTGTGTGNTVTVGASGAPIEPTVRGAIGLRIDGGASGTGVATLANYGTIASSATGVGANAVQIDRGTLVIGEQAGTLSGNLAIATAGSTLTVDRTAALTLANTITGAGALNKAGAGTTTLTGVNGTGNQFTGTANVTAGTLAVNGTFGDTAGRTATVNVNTAGTLHGSGTIAGSVVVGSGGTVSAGNSPGTMTIAGNHTLQAGSTSLFELGSAGVVGGTSNDLINVGGSLTLGGTLSLVSATNAASAPVSGAYRLYNYGGALAGTFGTVTTPSAASTALVYTNIPNQVNVLLTNGNQSVQYFDGADMTGATAGGQGGTGTWSAANTNWTTLPGGEVNDVWRSGVGIFGGTAGTVTVVGTQDVQGLQFATTGYTVTGGSLNLSGNPFNTDTSSFINVDANVATTISSAVVGSATVGLTKLGAGTMTLTGNNGYSGGTTFAAGILNAGSANALGTTGTLSFTGGTLQYSAANATDYSGRFSTAANQTYRVDTNGRDVTYATGLTSSGGSLAKLGAGMLTLTGASTYAGATTIGAGTLQVGGGGTSGSLAAGSAVTIAGGATLALNRSGTLAFGNAVSGAGSLTVRGATGANDSITLFGALRQTGGFTVADASNVTLTGSYSAAPSVSLAGGGTFTNQGSVNASSDAILTSQTAGTTVINEAGAQIVGGFSGVIQIQSAVPAALAVTNSGLIRGNGYDGVTQHGTGALTVTNNGTGVIYGQNGTMSGNGYGVGSDGGGALTLTNAAGGRIVGRYGVVGSNAGDQVTNAGTIASGTLNGDGSVAPGGVAGVDLRQGGTVINQAGGLIQGGGNALLSAGALVLRNAGTITSPSSDGILTSSTIDIRNAGTISSSVNSGLAAVSGSGTIVNATGGAFTGGSSAQFGYGVQFAGGSGTVENYGTLNSTRTTNGGSGGIYAYDRSGADLATVTANLYAGSTTGAITLGGGNDTVALNTGSGTAGAGVVTSDGVRLQNAGTLSAAAFGTIDLGGGINTLTLRGAGDGTAANGVAGTLALGSVSGAGTFNKVDAGTWTLTGQTAAPLAGMTANIGGGTLAINGVFGDTTANDATVNVNTGGTLHGSGTIAGSVVVASGGTVSAGNSPGTLTVNRDYTLNAGSTSLFELGASGVVGGTSNDLIAVGGNLQLGGTLSLVSATSAASAPVSGAYRIYNYGGALSGAFDTVTTPSAASTALVYTNIPNQVNVLLTNGNQSVQYFDGADMTGATAGGQGGTGTWSAANTNWTTLPGGQVNDVWRSGVGIFGGTAGTVTVAGAQSVQGLQFVTTGYQLAGTGTLNLIGDPVTSATQSFVNVDQGVGVTIANALTATGGTIGLRKLGDGTLTLTGASTYAGSTTVESGTLAIAAGGSVASAVVNAAIFTNAGTVGGGLTNNAGTSTNTGTINGGATILAGTFNTNAATSVVNGALVNAGTVNAQGQINGDVTNQTSATLNVVGELTGIGRLTNDGAVDLGGNNLGVGSLSGTTAAATIAGGGTLSAGSDNTSSAYAGTIAGATGLTKAGTGTLTLSGANTYTGATTVSAGTLQAGAVNALSAASAVTIATAGRMDLNSFNETVASLAGAGSVTLGSATLTTGGSNATTAYAGTISGTGGLVKTGTGGFTLSGANGFTGLTAIQAGTLTVAAGGSLAGSVNNAAGFTNAGSVAGSLTNSGSATNTGTVGGAVTNSGSLATSGTIGGGLTNTGTVTASAGRIDGAIANNAGSVTVSGQVASNGTLTNASGATLAVAGGGAYGLSGLLTNAGSLTVASGGSLTAPAGISNSGSIAVAQGGTITDALANTGSVVNDGAYNADVSNTASGTIANRATGVWTGNLTANAGTVGNAGQWSGDGRNDAGGSLTNTGTWTTATGPFANAGTLATSGVLNGGVANTGSVQASGQINGAVSNGAGASFALTGALTGVTTFANNGTLDLGGTAFTVGSLSGTSAAATLRNGALTTNGDNSSTAYAGTIVDGAAATSLTKNGTGSLTLTGTNTYTGGTIVNAGRLVATAASLGSGPVTSNSDLIIDQPGDATLGSAINGTGRFVKRGAGALTYTGTGTLSGATTVEAGRLSVNGGLANSVVTVANAATLGGAGTVGGVVAAAGGAVAPGASPGAVGTLRVAGNVLFASQSLYQVDATASGQSDRIAATGTATLQGGTVQVTAQAGLYNPTTSYTILSAAGGVTGRFAGVTSNFAYLTPFLTYDANDAYLRLARNDLQFATTAQTRNQGNVAGAAQATGVGSRLYDAIAVLSAPQSRVAFDALSGEIHASAVSAQFENAFLVREAVLDRLRWGDAGGFGGGIGGQGIGQRFAPGTTLPGAYTADLPGRAPTLAAIPTRLVDPQPIAVWGQGFGSFGSTATDGNAARLARQTSGFVLGGDARVGNDWRIGAAGGYSFTNLDVTGRLSSGTVESGYGALYAGGPLGDQSPLQLRLGATFGGNSLTTRRAVTFAGFSESAGARYGGTTGQGFAEVGYRVGTGTSYVEPFVGAAAIRLGRDGFSETGGASALTARGRDYDLATSTIGLRAEGRLSEVFASDLPIMVRALVGYRRAYGDVVPSALLAFAGGQQFVSAGIPIDRDALVAQAGIDWQFAPSTTLGVNYTGQVGQRAQDHGVKGNFTYRF